MTSLQALPDTRMSIVSTTVDFAGKPVLVELNRFAQQATASVLVRMGETVVHAAVTSGGVRDDIDWFPLSVEYQEKLYSVGKIKGSRWVKRDGRPNDDVVLKGRLIDRSIRPLFPEGLKQDVQIIVTVLSADGENDPDIGAMLAVSVGLSVSPIPWNGPVVGIRLGYQKEDKKLLLNPTYTEREQSQLDLVLSATEQAVVMVEAGADEISETDMLAAFEAGQTAIAKVVAELKPFLAKHSQPKLEFVPAVTPQELLDKVAKIAGDRITSFVHSWAKLEKYDKAGLMAELTEAFGETVSAKELDKAIYQLMKHEARRMTFEDKIRPDGRKTDEIRPLTCEVGLLPRTHGSAMFQRGSTQALTITTLGSPALNQLIESLEGEEQKRYIHHYNMPPFSVGETGRVGYPSRREIGHGALAERAVEPMIPSEESFPYTIHVVSEIMSSNGSTSMASVCGSTLSLMDAGVPLKRPVSGIAMGLLSDGKEYVVLSDIQGLEDFTGDMDFKVAGTSEGITAMQMDIKIDGIPMPVMEKALAQAKVGRAFILDAMLKALAAPRTELSPYAPKIKTVTIPVEKIGELIGPGGKIIKGLIASTGAEIEVKDDGRVFVSAIDPVAIETAVSTITNMMREVEPGDEYQGTVVRIESYGAFVNLFPGKDGLLHVSNMSTGFVRSAEDLVKMGETLKVRVLGVDDQGKVSLTTLTAEEQQQKESQAKADRFSGPRPNGGGFDRDRGGSRNGSFRSGPRRSGPRR